MRKTAAILAPLLLCSAPLQAQTALAEISVVSTDAGTLVEGSVIGLAKGQVQGELAVEKTDPSGRSSIVQTQDVNIEPGTRDVIGSVNLSMQDDASLSVILTIREDGREVAKATSSTLASRSE